MFTARQFVPSLCAAVLAVGCTSPDAAPTGEPAPVVVLTAVCDAVAADDPAVAEEAFGNAHSGLHDLGRELQDADRRDVAGGLLVAKQQVEEAFAATSVPDDLPDRLDLLAEATTDALAAVGSTRSTCP